MKVLLLVACLVALAVARNAEFENFKAKFGKTYRSQFEEKYRLGVFLKNLDLIKEHNAKFEQGKTTFTLGINQFADLTVKEFAEQNNNLLPRPANYVSKNLYQMPVGQVAAATVDWRNEGYVTPVKDQGQCGSCWSFSTTGSTEGQHFASTGNLVSLSEQNLMDCSYKEGNFACDGGLMDSAFDYIISNNGIDTEASYPYEEKSTENCRYTVANRGATVSNYKDVLKGSETQLQSASQSVGPISVAIDASHESFQLYQSGVYNERLCSTSQLDHGVLVVGYGTDAGTDYWLVKNSWGTSWGIKGYIEMTKDGSNQCGIATQASYPVV